MALKSRYVELQTGRVDYHFLPTKKIYMAPQFDTTDKVGSPTYSGTEEADFTSKVQTASREEDYISSWC
jgi:hypothetical protein